MDIRLLDNNTNNFNVSGIQNNPAMSPNRQNTPSQVPTTTQPDIGPAYKLDLSGKQPNTDGKSVDGNPKTGEATESKKTDGKCSTCESRVYIDDSDDAGVSFKTGGHIAPEASASMVMSHEREHIGIANADAGSDESKELISQSIRLYNATCPECGKSYVAGGEARTTMRISQQPIASPIGQNLDISA